MQEASRSNNWHYNNRLKLLARQLRNHATKAEKRIWDSLLSRKQMNGIAFTRQRPVLNFIADFMCKEKLFIIEVDGITHWDEGSVEKDKNRTKQLENIGFTVLRFSDSEVLFQLDLVRDKILDALD